MGFSPPGMVDVNCGEAEFMAIGPRIIHLDLLEMLSMCE